MISNKADHIVERALIIDYYDGALQGIASLVNDIRVFRFDVVAWDLKSNLRVFAFAPFPEGQLVWHAVENIMGSRVEKVSFWYPFLQTKDGLPSEAVLKLETVLVQALPYEHAWLTMDIEAEGSELVRLTSDRKAAAEHSRQTKEIDSLDDWVALFAKPGQPDASQ